MYRYLLFCYYDYYPCGGMSDCAFKTNNFDELALYIDNICNNDTFDNFHYYDIIEDKIVYADMEVYEDENGFSKYRFAEWEDGK